MDGSLLRFALLGLVAAISPVEMAASAGLNDNDPGGLAFESMCATCHGTNAFSCRIRNPGGQLLPDCV
jgi:cytochrome c553